MIQENYNTNITFERKMETLEKKSKQMKVHLGHLIQEKVNKSGYTITEFADLIGLSRPAVYQLFKKQSVDSDLLVRISVVLKENFAKSIYQVIEKELHHSGISETDSDAVTKCQVYEQNQNRMISKLDLIHKELIGIKEIVNEIKEAKV